MFVLKVLGSLSLQSESGFSSGPALQKRRLGLLGILAIGRHEGLSRDRLQAYLWPESPSDRSRHALDQLLYATRRALGSDSVISEGRSLRLDPGVLRPDLWQFEERIRSKDWAGAIALYGGPLLDGFHLCDSRELETWIDTERAKLQFEYNNALETVARDSAERGDTSSALLWWRRLVTSDPLSSRVALELMQALAAIGDRAGAIQHARAFQRLVRSELEAEPDPEIGIFAERLARPIKGESRGHAPNRRGAIDQNPLPGHEDAVIEIRQESIEKTSGGTRRAPSSLSQPTILAGIALLVVVLVGVFAMKGAAKVGSHRTSHEIRASQAARVVESGARALYLHGLNAWSARSKEGLDTAVIDFRRAIEIDPEYAEAYSGLADAYGLLGYSGYRPADAMFPKAKAAALRAIELDSTLASAHSALAWELTWERDFKTAEAEYKKAIRLDPGYATAHQWYAILLVILDRLPEAVVESGRAASLDPLSLQIQNTYGTFLNASGQRAAALRQFQKVASEEPDSVWVSRNPWLLTNMASAYAANGQYDKAIRSVEQALKVVPGHPRAVNDLAVLYTMMGKPQMASRAFAKADTLNEQYAAYRGMFYASEGKADSAFFWFGRVKSWGIPIMISLQVSGELKPIRSDPRYLALLRRIGLPRRAGGEKTRSPQ